MHIILLTLILMFATTPLVAAEDETIKIGEVVVTATRYEEKLSDVPANITVISENDIQNSTAQNIPDILRTSAGIHVTDVGGNRRNMTVDLRGFGETAVLNTLVLVDGRRVNESDLSGTDWTQIPLDRVKKIEIIRGGRGSVLYGDNASGGVINIITKEGDVTKVGASVAAGSYDTYKGNAYFSGSFKDLSYSFNGSYLSSDGYRTNSDTEAKDVGFNLNYYLNNIVKLNLSSGYHKDDTGLPGALKESDFTAGASRTDSVNPNDFAKVEDYYFKGGPEIYFWDDSIIKLDVSYRKRSSLSFSSFVGGNFLGDTDIKTLAASPQVIFRNKHGELKNTLTIGFDYQKAEEDILNNSSFSPGAQAFKLEKEDSGYYAHDEINIKDNILLSGGFRHDRADFTFDPGTPDETSMDEDLFTTGINYTYYKKSYVYASFSKSFRYPVLDELFNFITNEIDTGLTPQSSNDYEFGVRNYFTDNFYAHANFFRIDTEDEIIYNPTGGAFGFGANENLDGKTRRDGIELSLNAHPLEWLQLNGSYTYTDAKIRGGQFDGSAVPMIPRNKVTLSTVIDLGKGYSVALNGVYVGKRPFISDFENKFDYQNDYTVFNGKIKYQWKNITAFLDINNITGKKYSEFGTLSLFSSPVEKAFYPSPERNFLFGVSVEI
jgi:iron complex outermembrane receptor protein